MARDEWFRGPKWDRATRVLFEEKLSRARTQGAQHLRIKGYELTRADDKSVWAAGRSLLRRVIDEHPDDAFSVPDAHHDLGASFAREGRYEEAESQLVLALERHHHDRWGARLEIAELIVAAEWAGRYRDAARLLEEFIKSRSGLLPIEQLRVLMVEARIAVRTGDNEIARRDAKQALELLTHQTSPFPRHPGVGVAKADDATVKELETMARL